MARTKGDPISYDGIVWKPKPLPSLVQYLVMMPLWVICALVNLGAVILAFNDIDILWFVNLFFIIWSCISSRAALHGYRKTIAKRRQIRRCNEQDWWCQREMTQSMAERTGSVDRIELMNGTMAELMNKAL